MSRQSCSQRLWGMGVALVTALVGLLKASTPADPCAPSCPSASSPDCTSTSRPESGPGPVRDGTGHGALPPLWVRGAFLVPGAWAGMAGGRAIEASEVPTVNDSSRGGAKVLWRDGQHISCFRAGPLYVHPLLFHSASVFFLKITARACSSPCILF